MIEFYFSGITPSSVGGQPVQLYYMKKDNIPIRKSYITLALNTIYFKLSLVILGIISLIINSSYIINSDFIYKVFFIIGFVSDLLMIIFGILLLFKTNLIKKILSKILLFLKSKNIFKKKLDTINEQETMKRYNDDIKYIKSHKIIVIITLIITFIQRILLFSIIYFIYRSLGYNSHSHFELLTIQVTVQLSIEMLPLPGGAGLSESMLHSIFITIFSLKFADIGMLLTRGFTFYIPLIICGIVILIDYIFKKNRLTN